MNYHFPFRKKFGLLVFQILALFNLSAQSSLLSSSNLPIVVINTNGQTILNDPKITADLGIIYNGIGQRNSLTDAYNQYNGKIGIEIRGQSSQMFPMKSYGIELRLADGSSNNQPLLGMPSESDWVLYAPYTDKTLMRNVLAYGISNSLGRYAARCRYVELILNNDYKGIYVLMEKIKPGRAGIVKMKKSDIDGDALTGGYIFSLDKEPNAWYSSFPALKSANQSFPHFSYVYPKETDIVAQQKAYIKKQVDDFETALNSSNFQDPLIGVRKYADLNSFMDYFIVNEISRNVDGYRLSSYFNKDRDSKNPLIKAGPVWDYDLSFRNANYCNGSNVNGWAFQFNDVCPGDGAGLVPFWWEKLFTDSNYVKDLYKRWTQQRTSGLKTANLNQVIDSIVQLTDEARQRHFKRWPILGQYIWPNPNPIPNSYSEEISYLKVWLDQRLLWIDQNLPKQVKANWPESNTGTLQINVFPNPINSRSVIQILAKEEQTISVELFQVNGKLVYSTKKLMVAGLNQIDHNLFYLSSGIYLLVIKNGAGEKVITKLIK